MNARKRLLEEAQGTPLNPWNNDLDAFLVSWENLNAGGHGTWYDGSVEAPYEDELTEAYRTIDKQLNNAEAADRTETAEGEEEDDGENN